MKRNISNTTVSRVMMVIITDIKIIIAKIRL